MKPFEFIGICLILYCIWALLLHGLVVSAVFLVRKDTTVNAFYTIYMVRLSSSQQSAFPVSFASQFWLTEKIATFCMFSRHFSQKSCATWDKISLPISMAHVFPAISVFQVGCLADTLSLINGLLTYSCLTGFLLGEWFSSPLAVGVRKKCNYIWKQHKNITDLANGCLGRSPQSDDHGPHYRHKQTDRDSISHNACNRKFLDFLKKSLAFRSGAKQPKGCAPLFKSSQSLHSVASWWSFFIRNEFRPSMEASSQRTILTRPRWNRFISSRRFSRPQMDCSSSLATYSFYATYEWCSMRFLFIFIGSILVFPIF